MPPLSRDRVRNAAVFEVVGIEFPKPLYLRGDEKSWICLFIRAVYRTMHLKPSTNSCIRFYDAVVHILYTVAMGQTLLTNMTSSQT